MQIVALQCGLPWYWIPVAMVVIAGFLIYGLILTGRGYRKG